MWPRPYNRKTRVQGNNVTASKLFSSFSVVIESTVFLYNIVVYCQNKRISYMSDKQSPH